MKTFEAEVRELDEARKQPGVLLKERDLALNEARRARLDAEDLRQRVRQLEAEIAAARGVEEHPLMEAYQAAVQQVTHGKGLRHGGDLVDFRQQQWAALARCHGIGFLTGQAAKKLNESASIAEPENRVREILGAIAYAGMAILYLWEDAS